MDTSNIGALVHRSADLVWNEVERGREWGRQVTEVINANRNADVEILSFEEHFGTQNKLHWMMLFEDLAVYNEMRSNIHTDADFLALANPKVWEGLFVQGSVKDVVMQPIELLGEAAAR